MTPRVSGWGAADAAALLVGAVPVSPAWAFDCAAARGAVDRAICADPATKRADDAMNEAYERLRRQLSPEQAHALLLNQRHWLTSRTNPDAVGSTNGSCSVGEGRLASCLRDLDKARTRALRAEPVAGPGPPRPLVPFLVERPETRTGFDVGLFLFRFPEPATPAEAVFDAAMEEVVAGAPRSREPEAQFEPFFYHAAATIGHASSRLLSVKVDVLYWPGTVLPARSARTVNVDLAGGRLRLDDLLDARGRTAVTDSCIQQFREADHPGGDVEGGTLAELRASIGDLASWTFGMGAARVDLGYVHGHLYGDYGCTLPYPILRPLTKPSFPLPP